MACSRLVYERDPGAIVRHITAEHYFLNPVSNTFHGRDVFAPVAAWLAKNFQTEAFGEEVTDFVRFAVSAGEGGRHRAQRHRAARGYIRKFDDQFDG